MTGQAHARTDDLLTELVELVETARAVPMSASCVVPREHVLDLLDELREALPPEMDEAHVSSRTATAACRGRAVGAGAKATAEADPVTSAAEAAQIASDAEARHAGRRDSARMTSPRTPGHELVREAEGRAHEIVEAGEPSTRTWCRPAGAPDRAEGRRGARRGRGYRHGRRRLLRRSTRSAADQYAAACELTPRRIADRTLADLVAVLERATATAEQGRQALAAPARQRPADRPSIAGPAGPRRRVSDNPPISGAAAWLR